MSPPARCNALQGGLLRDTEAVFTGENYGRGPTRSAGESIRAPLWIYGYASVTSPSGNPVPTNSLLWGMIRLPTKAAKESQDIVHRDGVFVCGPVTAPYSSLTSRPGCVDVRAVSATSFCGPSCLLRFRVPDGLGGRRERIGCSELRVGDLLLVRCSIAQPKAPTNVFHFHPDLQQVVQSENPGRPGCLDQVLIA